MIFVIPRLKIMLYILYQLDKYEHPLLIVLFWFYYPPSIVLRFFFLLQNCHELALSNIIRRKKEDRKFKKNKQGI